MPTRAEALAILNTTPAPYAAVVALGLAGLGVGEVLGMSADRIDLAGRRVTVDRQLQRVGGLMVLTKPEAEKVPTIVVPGVVGFELRPQTFGTNCFDRSVAVRWSSDTPMLRRDQFYASAWHAALEGAGLAKDRSRPSGAARNASS